MKLKGILILMIVMIIFVSHVSAMDTTDWNEIKVNKVTFKIPDEYFNESEDKIYSGSYYYNDFSIVSCGL